jgi:phospholipid/cholesterol/gamma-HCH transport system permease protein
MKLLSYLQSLLRDLGRSTWRWAANWWRIVHLGAVILVLAVSPSSYRREHWPLLARQLYLATAPVLLWFTVLSSLLGLVLIRIVVVTALSYGLSQYAVEMVVRVLVLELIPLGAALFVALRCTIPQGAEVLAMRGRGEFDAMRARHQDPVTTVVLPRALAGMFSVLMLAAVSCVVALVLAYLTIHGFTPWAIGSYTRAVGHVFNPAVTMIFAFKTLFFSLAVSLIPMASSLYAVTDADERPRSELQTLVRMALALLAIEAVSLLGNYY